MLSASLNKTFPSFLTQYNNYVYACVHMYINIHIHVRMYMYTHTYMSVRVYIYIYTFETKSLYTSVNNKTNHFIHSV